MTTQEWPKCTACGEWMRECMCANFPTYNWLVREFIRANERADLLPPNDPGRTGCGHPNHGAPDHACAPFSTEATA